MAALEVVPLYASDLPQTQDPGPQDPYALVAWGGAEAATSPHLGGERYPVWNELLSFPLGSPSGSPAAAEAATPLSPLRVSLRHHTMTVFQRDSVIAEATVPLPAPEALASPGARPMCPQGSHCASLRVVCSRTSAGGAELLVPLAPSGALRLRLRLRLRRAPGEPPVPEPASADSGAMTADDAPSELLGEARGPSSSFISWSSAMEDLSGSFAARDVPEDPEHPDGAGTESPAAVPRRAHVTPAGAAQAAAEGMLPLAADDVAGEAAFPFAPQPSTSDEGIMLVEGAAADVAEAEPGGAGGGYALVSSPALWPASGPRGGTASEEAWEEADAPDADGEDERRLYYGADVAMPQEYGSSSDDPYAPSDEDEGKRGRRGEGESSGAEESSGSDFDEEGNLVPKEP